MALGLANLNQNDASLRRNFFIGQRSSSSSFSKSHAPPNQLMAGIERKFRFETSAAHCHKRLIPPVGVVEAQTCTKSVGGTQIGKLLARH